MKYIQQVLDHTKDIKYGSLATVVGRYYAMDRDKRFERIQIAYEGLVQGIGEKATPENIVQVNSIEISTKTSSFVYLLLPFCCAKNSLYNSTFAERSFSVYGPKMWNKLPTQI